MQRRGSQYAPPRDAYPDPRVARKLRSMPLSGEIHATVSGVLADHSRYVREVMARPKCLPTGSLRLKAKEEAVGQRPLRVIGGHQPSD